MKLKGSFFNKSLILKICLSLVIISIPLLGFTTDSCCCAPETDWKQCTELKRVTFVFQDENGNQVIPDAASTITCGLDDPGSSPYIQFGTYGVTNNNGSITINLAKPIPKSQANTVLSEFSISSSRLCGGSCGIATNGRPLCIIYSIKGKISTPTITDDCTIIVRLVLVPHCLDCSNCPS